MNIGNDTPSPTPFNARQAGWLVAELALLTVVFIVLQSLFYVCYLPFRDKADVLLSQVVDVALWATASLLAAWAVLWFRRCPLRQVGLAWQGWNRLTRGAAVALAIYAVGFGLSVAAGWVEVAALHLYPGELAGTLAYFFFVAFSEEVLFRGMALGRMLDKGLSPAVALLLSSALFALAHGANPGIGLLSLVNIALAGALMGAAYLRQRNLWEPIALHWAWNWLQGPVLGYGVSGITMGSPMLELHLAGSPLLTGGAFGFEASLPCTVLLALALGFLAWRNSSIFCSDKA